MILLPLIADSNASLLLPLPLINGLNASLLLPLPLSLIDAFDASVLLPMPPLIADSDAPDAVSDASDVDPLISIMVLMILVPTRFLFLLMPIFQNGCWPCTALLCGLNN